METSKKLINPSSKQLDKYQLNQKQLQEFFYMLKREYKKLTEIFKHIKLKEIKGKEKEIKESDQIQQQIRQLFQLALAYWKDLQYWMQRREWVKAFELINYIWGLLDGLATLKAIKVPKKTKPWFKAEF